MFVVETEKPQARLPATLSLRDPDVGVLANASIDIHARRSKPRTKCSTTTRGSSL
jgi:hypothetical protein